MASGLGVISFSPWEGSWASSVWQWLVEGCWVFVTIIASKMEEVVFSSYNLSVDRVNCERSSVGAELGIKASDVAVDQISVFLGNFALWVSSC